MRMTLVKSGYMYDEQQAIWIRPDFSGIAYSDGDEVEQRIASIIDNATDLSVLSSELRQHCTDWPSLYHFSGTRANILRPFEPDLRGDILEIGAGCGAITRYLGECGGNVLALEGSPRRAAIARARTRELKNVAIVCDKFDQFHCGKDFDVITLIGVLEYANLFSSGDNPALTMLERARSFLKPSGKLIIAIENQLGLKYFAGAPEDHVGQPMYGIEGRYRKDQPQTYGRAVLSRMLSEAGYAANLFLAPFPDYKLPISIISEPGMGRDDFDAAALAWQSARRDPQLPANLGFSLELAWSAIFDNQLSVDLANSFLIVASPENLDLQDREVLAYHYSTDRAPQFCKETTFKLDGKKGGIVVNYKRVGGVGRSESNRLPIINFVCPKSDVYHPGRPLAYEFLRLVARDGWRIEEVKSFLQKYLRILAELAREQGVLVDLESPYSLLPGNYFDVVPNNLILHKDNSVSLIDKEWELTFSIELGHLIFRMLLQLIGAVSHFGSTPIEGMTRGQFISSVLESLRLPLLPADYDRYMKIEEQITEHVTGRPAKEAVRWWPDHPLRAFRLSEIIAERDGQIAGLNHALVERDGQIAGLNHALVERDGQIANLSQAVADARRELTHVLASKSWQITKPFRFARRVVTKAYAATRRVLSDSSRALWRALPITYESKLKLKRILFKTFPWIFRWTKAYQAWNAFDAPFKYAPPAQRLIETGDEYVPLIDASPLEQRPAKLICFYLPQFHAIPENDEWWGEGFTEWTNVQPAQPQFVGHYQPHVPGELGYYNLLDPNVQRRQVELAKLYGIEGFCFYFYWFGGKRLLEKPIENYLNDQTLDLPFCLCWANENWSRRWDGLDSEILMAQQHSVDDDFAFIRHVSQYMRDQRYIRINGKPLLLVYRPSLLPSAQKTASRWRDWCRANGVGEIYLAYTQSFETVDPRQYGFDAAIEFPPNNSAPPNITDSVTPIGEDFGSTIYDWRVFVERSEQYKQQAYILFRSVCPSWDNTARRKNRGTVFENSTPMLYQRWLEKAIPDTQAHRPNPDERLIFVNAWNEWAEGAHLEPDARYGYAYLQATRNALEAKAADGCRRILLVTHDCHPHGAQFLALEVTRQLVRNGFLPAIVALEGGKLQAEFAQLGPMLLVNSAGEAALHSFLANYRSLGCSDIITSTVVTGGLLPELKKYGFRVLSLIHELPGVIRSMKQENNAQLIAELADKIVFPAQLVRDQYATIAPVANEKAIIRPQGLLRKNPYQGNNQEARRLVCQRHELPFDTRIVLNIGYLDQRKGADLFVEIAAQVCQHLSDTVFIWVGHAEQELEYKVRARIRELGLEKRIMLVGFDSEPLVYYAAAAVYALTSREDPFPNVVLESASVGVPVVAFEGTTGAEDFIVQQGGLLARHLDVAHFAENLEELLSHQAALPSRLLPDLSLQRYVLDLLHYLSGKARVSVIVPNYNYGRLIKRRLDSIQTQSYPVYELIVLDDASTDDSVTNIENYCRESGCEAKLFVNKSNSGSVFRQWVKGAQMATGDIVWIAEADDIADPNFLSCLVPVFSEKGTVLAFCQSRQIDEKGRVIANDYLAYTDDISERWRKDHFGDGMDEIRESLSIKNVIPNVSGVLFNRQALLQAFEQIGDELFDYLVAGDWLVYLHVLAQGRLYYCAKSLNDHRRHQKSVTSATSRANHLAEVAKVQSIAQAIALPDENVLAQAKDYLVRLREQFGLDNLSVDGGSDAKRHIA